MNRNTNDILMHYGVGALDGPPGRGSGRYPYGSGQNPHQHSGDFISRVEKLKQAGLTESQIAKAMGFGHEDKKGNFHVETTKYRAALSIAKTELKNSRAATARQLREEGYSLGEIATKMGFKNDSSVRALLNEDTAARRNRARLTADFLKSQVDEKGMIDVGVGVERELGNISRTKMDEALELLKLEGYEVYNRRLHQVTNPKQSTELKVLCPPGTEYKDVYTTENIHSLQDYITRDGGETFDPKWVYPASMDSKRLAIRYAEDGGTQKDGVIELRRGVDDLSLGSSHYAQVRILVDGTHYIKGMAVYSDDLPEGCDVLFNTNKKAGTPVKKVLKEIGNDPENPFGSLIKEGINEPDDPFEKGGQSYYIDKDGKKRLSLINKRADEGDWGEWKDKVPAQFLAKQPLELINKQLQLAIDEKVAEFDEVRSLNNPTVKKNLLQSFADDCDSAAVHLQAAALPRQKYQVILPLTSIKDTEVYAPTYIDGETVALVRFPFASNAEMPILKVNNKLPEGKKVLGASPKDAIGINKNVADRMSGADFDGDTVMVIPCNSEHSKVRLKSIPQFEELKGFDTKLAYGADEEKKDSDGVTHYIRNGKEYRLMGEAFKQNEMGRVSNLITDMTIRGANEHEIAKAIKHSMVVIDAVKHHLDYKQSEIDNDIKYLRNRYQSSTDEEGNIHTGASTLISRAKSPVNVDKRQGSGYINQKGKPWYDESRPEGAMIYKTADDLYYIDKKTGKQVKRTQESTKMAEADDARTLISEFNAPQEIAYANFANTMKSLGNQARKEMVSTGRIQYSASAKAAYQAEVDSLTAKLNVALKNAPREREAQRIATVNVEAKKQSNPDMTKAELKKARQQALTAARTLVGAERTPVDITDREWEAIQAGAISEATLTKILNNTDIDKIKERATPRTVKELSSAQKSRIISLKSNGYTTEEIARAVGVSSSTVTKYL